MNTELFIARRLFFDKSNRKFLSQRIIKIALAGIALGLTVMIISVAVVTGFKKEIRDKVIGFGSHIRIISLNSNNSYETQPLTKDNLILPQILDIDGVRSISTYATKPGMIKTDEYTQGVVLKGIDRDYDMSFFENNLLEGRLPEFKDSVRSKEIIISEQISNLLKVGLNDKVVVYFINANELTPRILQLTVSGIYRSSLEEFDKLFILGDIKQIQRINNWNNNQVSGYEVEINNFNEIDKINQQVRNVVLDYSGSNNEILTSISITQAYPQIFDWLNIVDMNVWIILSLMVLVAGFNMISGLLVLILERSRMIGVLKSLGNNNWSNRKIFLYLSGFMTMRGLLWGNIIGVGLVLIQKYFQVFKLNPTSYYVDVVPINFSIMHLLLLNIATIVIIMVMLIVPSYLISRISPDKSIRFD